MADAARSPREGAATLSKISLERGTLSLSGQVARSEFGAVEEAVRKLELSPAQTVTLDLSACSCTSSLFIGLLVDAIASLRSAGKKVKVKVSPEVGRFLNTAHLYHLFDYSIVD